MAPGARVVLFESVVGAPNEDPGSKFFDLLMRVSAGGRERTEAEWSALLDARRFRLESVKSAGPSRYAIVGVPL